MLKSLFVCLSLSRHGPILSLNHSGAPRTSIPWGKPRVLTGAATFEVSDDATEVPEARLTAVTLQSPDARFAGALPRGRITTASIGAMEVAVTGTYQRGQKQSPKQVIRE